MDSGPHDKNNPWWFVMPASLYAGITVVVFILQYVGNRVLRNDFVCCVPRNETLIAGLYQFDGPEYVNIASGGYSYTPGERSHIVWFPDYPNLMRFVHLVIDNWKVSGIVVSLIGGMTAALLVGKWLQTKGLDTLGRRWGLVAVLLYPYGWYLFGVIHSDAVFLALVVAAFLSIEKDHYVLAGVLGAAATATRPTGLAVIPGLVAHGLVHDQVTYFRAYANEELSGDRVKSCINQFHVPNVFDFSRLRARHAAPLLTVVGVGAFGLYLGIRFGEPLAFVTNQRTYHQPAGIGNVFKVWYFQSFSPTQEPVHTLTKTGQAVVLCTVLASVPFVGRKFGWGYGVFVGVLGLIPTFSSEDFMGVGRYMMAAFPTWVTIGCWLSKAENRWRRVGYFGLSGALWVVMVIGFSRSWYLT